MATVYLLKNSYQGWYIKLTLVGRKLITGAGDDATVQTFPSPAAAKEHLENVIGRRKKDGYAVESATEIDDNDPAAAEAVDPLRGRLSIDPATKKAIITFKGDKISPRMCAQIVERLRAAAPSWVQIICDPQSPGDAFPKALDGKPLPSIKAFIFDTHFQTGTRQRENSLGDIAQTLSALPSLERAFFTGKITLRATQHSALRELYLLGDPLKAHALQGLGASSFPALDTLALRLCDDAAPGPEGAAIAAVRAINAPSLRALHIDGIMDVPRFLEDLTSEPLPASLSTLCLGGAVDDEDDLLRVLELRAPALAQLETLGLPLSDDLPDDTEERAEAIVGAVADLDDLDEMFLPDTYLAFTA